MPKSGDFEFHHCSAIETYEVFNYYETNRLMHSPMDLSILGEPPSNCEGRKTQLIFNVKILKIETQLQQIPITSNDLSPAGIQSCTQNQIRGVAYGNYSGHRCHGCCTVAKMKNFKTEIWGYSPFTVL